ncbi:MAG TPA: class I SAM-dependent methyltransferase [Myxococcaceae bacterium]|nr:class I SAM-dependent methyltransferase [Myxococcaceae bacterium]
MDTGKIRLTKEKETYLATLYGKALDARAPRPILGDHFAAEAVDRIDHDFRKLKLPRGGAISLPIRALHLDGWTRAFLGKHPESTVLHLGCGLDTRVFRIDPGPEVRWFDVDFPDVIALREKLYPERAGYQRIGTSVTDLAWLDAVPGDKPVMVIGEGLFMYLPEPDGLALLRRIAEKFPSGELIFDAYSRSMIRLVSRLAAVRGAKVELVWGVADPHDLERAVPRLRLAEDVPFLTMPELMSRMAKSRVQQVLNRWFARRAFVRKLVRHLRYEFG